MTAIIGKTFLTYSSGETQSIGARLAAELNVGDTVFLFGGLGAGKTTFVQGLAEALGFNAAASPTFTILHPYDCKLAGRGIKLYHFDCYRLGSAEELFSCGLDEYLDGSDSIAVVEWPENVREAWPERYISVRITQQPGGVEKREIEISREFLKFQEYH